MKKILLWSAASLGVIVAIGLLPDQDSGAEVGVRKYEPASAPRLAA